MDLGRTDVMYTRQISLFRGYLKVKYLRVNKLK